VDKIVAVVL